MALNTIAIAGNLTRDPELRMSQEGTAIISFTVAVNNRKPSDGGWVDDPAFVPCVMFGTRAQSLAPHLAKGTKVGVSGRISENRWQDKQTGQNRSRLEVIVNDLDFMGPKRERSGGYQASPQAYQQRAPLPVAAPTQGRLTGSDDIPF